MPSIAAHANDRAPSSDRRLYSRQPIQSLAYVELDEGNGGIVLNVSEGGLSVHAVMSLVEDMLPRLRFQLAQSKDWIETSARVAWTNESRKVAGLQFVDMHEPTRARLREWLSLETLETSPAKVAEVRQEENAPSGQSQGPLPPAGSPGAAPPVDESPLAPPLAAEEERYKNAPTISGTAAGPPAIAAAPTSSAQPAPVYMFGRLFDELHHSGLDLSDQLPERTSRDAKSSRRMWVLAGLLVFLAVASMAAGWVAGHGTLGALFSTIHGTTPPSNGQQENVMLPSVRPPARISEIEIVDANNQVWVIPFGPLGSGIEENPRRQTPVNTPTQTRDRPAVEPPTSAPEHPIGESILPEKTNPPVSPALLSNPQNVSPAPTKSHIEVPPPQPVPSTEIPQAGVLQPGEIVRRVDPIYPESAQAQRIEGTVKLRVTIGTDGAVRSVTAISGPGPLVEAARAAVRQWRYTPTLLDGKPVEAEEYVSIVFQLPPGSR